MIKLLWLMVPLDCTQTVPAYRRRLKTMRSVDLKMVEEHAIAYEESDAGNMAAI